MTQPQVSPLPMCGALGASKAALDSLSDALRMELRHLGVQVSYVEPGGLRTEFFQKSADTTRYTGGAETRRVYGKAIDASTKAMASARTTPVAAAVAAIVKALVAKKPSARYRVGPEARYALPLLLSLPDWLRDRILMSALGLRREMFDTEGVGTRQP